jgi:two-component system phosphate regulon response regulator PhoB
MGEGEDGAHGTVILIVEDDRALRRLLVEQLALEGYRPVPAADGVEALARARAHRPRIVLLDLNLPDMAGEDVCRRLKGDPATAEAAVLMVTGKAGEADRIAGLEAGAEDYIGKPFSLRELILRVEAVRRRLAAAHAGEGRGGIVVDDRGLGVHVGGRMVQLTSIEMRLFEALLEMAGQVCTREELEARAWAGPGGGRKLRTYVGRLRQKLGAAGVSIETVRAIGYRLRPPD